MVYNFVYNILLIIFQIILQPAGRAVGQTGKYYQTPKDNKCVVCGETEKYTRKNVVPREYRKNFPFVMKDHASHDVVLLCPRCHQVSNRQDSLLRESLAFECNAPFPAKNTAKTTEVPRLKYECFNNYN